MASYHKMEQITKTLNAISKIRNIHSSNYRGDGEPLPAEKKVDTLRQALHVVSEYSSETRGESMVEALYRSSVYYEAYRNLKEHMRLSRGQPPAIDSIVTALSMINPVLDRKSGRFFNKLVKIYEIIKS